MKTLLLPVNLQQGLFIDENNIVLGVYTHHTKIIVPKFPFTGNDLTIPDNMRDYEIKENYADSFGLNMWTNKGRKELY